ncbi:MAG: cation:proton antiporter [Verrucomicrobia bacterium]|nr:cation:proton antiporter [Verrucomicrobiota bacterium]MBU1908780.1 cation:proton antiporter [Verrucomicrobiota bacterium]
MPEVVYILFLVGLLLCCGMCLYRIGRGPTSSDRMVGIDILGTVVVGFAALVSIATGKDYILNVAIAWALVSFIGTIALAKHLEGKGFNE